MASLTIDVAIIGGGPGGLEAAQQAARAGLKTAIISNSPPGGRATWSSLIPSKIWLKEAYQWAQHASNKGFDASHLPKKIQHFSQTLSNDYQKQLQQLGIHWITGSGTLTDPGRIQVEGLQQEITTIYARYTIIATGSLPRFTEQLRPNGQRIIAPRLMAQLDQLPRSLIMIGGGVTGTEYATVFAELGVDVTVVTDLPHLLPRLDPEISKTVEAFLQQSKGITLITHQPVSSVQQQEHQVSVVLSSGKTLQAEMAFIAIGRKADWQFATAELRAQLSNTAGFVQHRSNSATSVEGLYAVGDVTGAPMMVNRARWQARAAIHHILGEVPAEPVALIEAVFTHPPIASIRHPQRSATAEPHLRIDREFRPLVKSRLHEHTTGQLVVLVSKTDGMILEAHAFGPAAPEILAPFQLAINHNISWKNLQAVPLAHPTFSEIITA